MKRKKFIQTTSLALAGGIIVPQMSCASKKNTVMPQADPIRKNWAGNYTYKAGAVYEPDSVEEVQHLVKTLKYQKALGSRHCFNDIADSPQNQISTKKLNRVIQLNETDKSLTVESGARYGEFSVALYEKGYALPNLASLPHITVAGACATATHGSGVRNGNLAAPVLSVELVTPKGNVVTLDRNHPDFYAVVVGLGAFGIITKVTLQLEAAYEVRQDVFLDLPMQAVEKHFDAIMSAGYSVSLFTDWMDRKVSEVWVKRRIDSRPEDLGSDFYGAKEAAKNIHPIAALSAESCTEQMGVAGPWYERLPHFKMNFTPSAGEELQSEYYIPKEHAVAGLLAMEKMKDKIFPHLLISEIRTIASDQFWLSPCYNQDSITIHCTWKQHPQEVMALLPQIEEALAPYNVRPHWGKLFTIAPDILQSRYPKFNDFRALAGKYDPEGHYRNAYLDLNIY